MSGSGSGAVLLLRGFVCLVLLSAASAEGDKRSAPVKLREHLWATGHFMGKRSSPWSTHIQSSSLERADMNNVPKDVSPVGVLEDMKELLMRELLKILLQEKLLEENQMKWDPQDQETPSLMKVMAKYIQRE